MQDLDLKFKEYSWLPEHIIVDAINNRWETSLSYLLILGNAYDKPIFYNYTYRNISEKTGISTAVLHRHIKRLIDKGLMYVHGKNLCIKGIDKLKLHPKELLIAIPKGDNKKSTILNIQFTRLLKNLRQQKHITVKKIATIKMHKSNFTPFGDAKRLLKQEAKLFKNVTEKSANNYYMLSNKGFGSATNRSKSTGKLIQKRMNEAGLIKSERNSKLFSSEVFNKRAFYNLCLPARFVHSKDGKVYERLPNKITLLA